MEKARQNEAAVEASRAVPGIPRDADGPVFREPWEAQAFAMAVTLHARGLFTWKEWAAALADQIKSAQAGRRSRYGRNVLPALVGDAGATGRRQGRRKLEHAAALPPGMGPRRGPHATWFTDRIEAGGFQVIMIDRRNFLKVSTLASVVSLAKFRWHKRNRRPRLAPVSCF